MNGSTTGCGHYCYSAVRSAIAPENQKRLALRNITFLAIKWQDHSTYT